MSKALSGDDLRLLIQRVFQPGPEDHGLAIIVDLPDERLPDNPDWRERRKLAQAWGRLLTEQRAALGLERVTVAWYRNAGSNNADLPADCVCGDADFLPTSAAVSSLMSAAVPIWPSSSAARAGQRRSSTARRDGTKDPRVPGQHSSSSASASSKRSLATSLASRLAGSSLACASPFPLH